MAKKVSNKNAARLIALETQTVRYCNNTNFMHFYHSEQIPVSLVSYYLGILHLFYCTDKTERCQCPAVS